MTTKQSRHRLVCFGLGYTALRLAEALGREAWSVAGTCREADRAAALSARGIEARVFDGETPLSGMDELLAGATHILVSCPPGADGDPVIAHHRAHIADASGVEWIGYLSTTGVYGDRDGGLVDERSALEPTSARGHRRVEAEAAWRAVGRAHGLAVHIFRLAGIYGPGRSALDQVRAGTARRIVKPGHAFSRIHVDDIVTVLRASMARPDPGAIYNVCDDRAAPSADVVAFACALLGVAPPPETAFADAGLSDMARSFYADNKRVDNRRIKDELGVRLLHPDYESGLRAIAAAGG